MRKLFLNLKTWVSIIAVVLVILHMLFPNLAIDSITVTLFVIALIPWMSSFLKSVTLPGGFGVEYKDLEKISEKVEKFGIFESVLYRKNDQYEPNVFEPELILAWLRIEIEKRIRKICEIKEIGDKQRGLSGMLNILQHKEVLSAQEINILRDINYSLNKAAHGQHVNQRVTRWIIDIAPKILSGLDAKINEL